MMGRPNVCLQAAGDRAPTPKLRPEEILRRFGITKDKIKAVVKADKKEEEDGE